MDSSTFITTMPSMDIFAHQAGEVVPGTEKSMLRRQKAVPERRLGQAFDSDEYCDFDMEDDYFSQTYAPLSCLPTPPMSFEADSPFSSALEAAFEDDEDNDLLGPAIHMSNLIPSSASLLTPSPTLVQDILHRASLPSPILELAVIILDSLTPRFATNWRNQLPLSSDQEREQRIDDVHPELIAASSLLIAHKFLDDNECPSSRFSCFVCAGLWTCQQINTTERLILDCINWNIKELCNDWFLGEAREDMERAGANARRKMNKAMKKKPTLHRKNASVGLKDDYQMLEMSIEQVDGGFEAQEKGSDRSVQFMGQWTPAESPIAKGRMECQ